jgi:aminodeoxyfutalosine deaminase
MARQESITFTARWIFPVDAPPLEQGTITIQGCQIHAVEPHGTRHADVDFGNAAILPGFVNAHTHLDLTGLRGQCAPTSDFTAWLRRVIQHRRTRSREETQIDIATGIVECQRFGTTTLGDISDASWDLLMRARISKIIFYELLGLPIDRAKVAWDDFSRFALETNPPTIPNPSFGISPHAPYSVHRMLFERSAKEDCCVAIHLAESLEELELLRSRTGPFVDLLRELNVYAPEGLVRGPEEIIKMFSNRSRGWFSRSQSPTLFIHANYLDPALPISQHQSIVVCPRTHAAFGHSRHPFPEMLRRGVRVALGTDSLASNPDLDILAEARFLRQHYSEVEPAMLLRMLTLSGAEALELSSMTGSLTAGKWANLVVLPLPNVDTIDPHDLILQSITAVRGVMYSGGWVHDPLVSK